MFSELLQNRRSIRKFKDMPLHQEAIDSLCRAALLSPSSRNKNPWEFILVRDKARLSHLSMAKQGAGFLKGAALGIVIIADPGKSDVWIEDTSIAATLLLCQAEALGLGACWAQIRSRMYNTETTAEEYVRKILSIPDHFKVEAIIGTGYPAENRPPHREEDLQQQKLHNEQFSFR